MTAVAWVRIGGGRPLASRTRGNVAIVLVVALGCAVSRGGDEEPSRVQAIGDGVAAHDAESVEVSRDEDAEKTRGDTTFGRGQGPAETPGSGATDPASALVADAASPEMGLEDPTAILPPNAPEASTIGRGRAELAPGLQPLPRSRWIEHRRVPRESLTQIAHRYAVSEDKLREWNGLLPDEPIPRRTKRLRVRARRLPPPRERIAYTVQEGDTWWSVALRHGVDGRDLRAYNYPYRKKMQPGATLQVWIDPIVHDWIAAGPDPLPPDRDRGMRRGAVSIGSPADGVLLNGLRIPDDDGLQLRLPRSAYGTSHAVEQLMLAAAAFRERSDYPLPIPVGSMSRPRGGPIGGHRSHQSGRDVDLRLLRRPEVPAWQETRGSRVQWDAVWQLVLAFAEVDVMVIFLDYRAQRRLHRAARAQGASDEQLEAMLQYPRGSKASRGLVRHSDGHEQHLHVRFGCGPHETECVP